MSAGKTYWWAKDAAWIDRDYVVELGEEHGPAGPLVLDVLSGQAKLENDGGRILTGFRALARKAFLKDAAHARRIVEHAAEIGAIDDLELLDGERRFTCRISGWQADQTKGRAAQRQAIKRDRDTEDVTPEDTESQGVTDRDVSPHVTPRHASVGDRTGQDREETASVAASGDGPVEDDVDEPKSLAVRRIWAAYNDTRLAVLGARSGAKLTAARRKLIDRRLKEWPETDLADAARGWRHFPHNRGENERHQPYCDLELLFRDAAHIERFRDAERNTATNGAVGPATNLEAWL